MRLGAGYVPVDDIIVGIKVDNRATFTGLWDNSARFSGLVKPLDPVSR